jgi:DNA-binding XRE family transcriptional regulator
MIPSEWVWNRCQTQIPLKKIAMNDSDSEFYRRLITAFEQRGLGTKQIEMAKTLGVTQPSVHQWKVGRNYPDLDTIRKIGKLTNVCVEWLYSGLGPMRPGGDVPEATIGSIANICEKISPSGRASVQTFAEYTLKSETVE